MTSPHDFTASIRRRRLILPGLCVAAVLPLGALIAQQPTPADPLVTKDQFIQELSRPSAPPGMRTRSLKVVGTPFVSVRILFKTGSVEPADEASLRQLREAGEALRSESLAAFRFQVEGHTDSTGGAEYNLRLSRRRAESIVAYLHARYQIGLDRLEPIGKGATEPVAGNDTEEGRSKNRRVVFKRRE